MTFVSSDLGIGDAELSALTTALASAAVPDPVTAEIAAQVARVDRYTAERTVAEVDWKRFVRVLTLFELHRRAGNVTDSAKAANDAAVKELEEIRDARFTSASAAEVTDTVTSIPSRSSFNGL